MGIKVDDMQRIIGRRHFEERGGFKIDIGIKMEARKVPFKKFPDPKVAVVLLHQHIGEPNEPLVEEGDEVKEGQTIGSSKAFVSAPVHSPISGNIVKVGKMFHPMFRWDSGAIFIENDGRSDKLRIEKSLRESELDETNPKKLVNIIRDAGIVGQGGAAFPTHVKLSPPAKARLKYLIVNAVEGDPYLACDERLMLESADDITRGIKVMVRILSVEKVIFATRMPEEESPRLEELLGQEGVSIRRVAPSYSIGSERMLIKELLGKEVPFGKYPYQVGVVVHNVATAHVVARAVFYGEPLISRGITFVSHETGPKNFWVKIGTPVGEIFDYLHLDRGTLDRVVLGSSMMGNAIPHLGVPTIKSTAGVIAFTHREKSPFVDAVRCTRCGYCITVCPMDLYPIMIMDAEERGDKKMLRKLCVQDCIDCGLCSYVCPSRIKLTEFLLRGRARAKVRTPIFR